MFGSDAIDNDDHEDFLLKFGLLEIDDVVTKEMKGFFLDFYPALLVFGIHKVFDVVGIFGFIGEWWLFIIKV